jgi:hypothetical protein
MLRFLILAAAWKLMRQYVSRRRIRLGRERIVRLMAEKLQALKRRATPRSVALANAAPIAAVPVPGTGQPLPPNGRPSSAAETDSPQPSPRGSSSTDLVTEH